MSLPLEAIPAEAGIRSKINVNWRCRRHRNPQGLLGPGVGPPIPLARGPVPLEPAIVLATRPGSTPAPVAALLTTVEDTPAPSAALITDTASPPARITAPMADTGIDTRKDHGRGQAAGVHTCSEGRLGDVGGTLALA